MKYVFYVMLGILLWVGCNDSETLTPTKEAEPGYYLPQGDHDYDEKIVDWNKRAGIYILYKYKPNDLFFNLGVSWLELTADTLERTVSYEIDGLYVQVNDDYAQIMTNSGVRFYYFPEGINNNGFPYTASHDNEFVTISETYIETGNSKSGCFKLEMPDEDYVGKQVELLENTFLKFYPDNIIKKYAPVKYMLGKDLMFLGSSGGVDIKKNFLFVSNMLVLNNGDESINSFTTMQRKTIKNEINKEIILNKMYDDIKTEVEALGFFKISEYDTIKKKGETLALTPFNRELYKWGITNHDVYLIRNGKDNTVEKMKTSDLKSYLCVVIKQAETYLNRAPSSANWMSADDAQGILTDKRDVNHKIRDKYDIVIKALKKLGVDLQAIGNYTGV